MKIKFKTKEPIPTEYFEGIKIKRLFENNEYIYQIDQDITSQQRRMLYEHPNVLRFIVDRENCKPV